MDVAYGFKIDGTVKTPGIGYNWNKMSSSTGFALGDTGVLELTSTANVNDSSYGTNPTSLDLSKVTGTGTLKYSSTAGWRAFPDADARMPASTLTLQMELADSLIISKNDGATVIGNLAGSKNIRSDFGNNGSNGRILTVTQSKDAEWEGTFVANRLTKFNVVAPAEGTPGTLTLSGTQSLSTYDVKTIPMQVDGSVNLTGTWVGNTTVAGTFGGTGTLTGSLTFSDGATLKANSSALAVSGAVVFPAEADDEVTVDMTGVTPVSGGTTLISSSTSMGSVSKLTASGAALKVVGNDLKAYPIVATYGGKNYATFADAIDVALADEGGAANLANITVVDGTAELPDWYVIQDNTIKVAVAAKVIPESSTTYYATLQEAVDNVNVSSYVEIHADSLVATSSETSIFIKPGAYTFAITSTKAGYGDFVQGTEILTGVYSYAPETHAATFVWNGGASGAWNDVANWTSTDGTVAVPPSDALYTIDFSSAATVSINSDKNVAQMNVGAIVSLNSASAENTYAITVASGGTIALTTVSASLAVTRISPSSAPVLGGELSPESYYVKSVTSGSTTTYSVDAYNTVAFTAPNATVTRTDALGNAIKDGDTITFTVAADQGYSVTGVSASSGSVSGAGPYSYVVNGNATITVTTQQDAQITGVVFDYYVGYTNADVRVTVDQAGTYTLTVRGTEYEQTALEAGTITFENVDVTGVSTSSGVAYTITASEGASGTTGGTSPAQSSGTVTDTGWMAWSENGVNVGTWSADEPSYTAGEAAFSGTNTYTAAWISTGEVVTVTTSVKFGDVADPDMTIDANAQAAVRIGAGNVFQVYAGSTPDWVNVYNDELGSPDGDVQYGVTVKLNYSTQTYGVDITKLAATYPLTNATGGAAFPLAKAASAMQQVSYLGAGSFISLSGEYVSAGYTANVGTEGSATNVVVSSDFVSTYMGDVLASNVSAALSPTNTTKQANGLNYFASYALGLDPTDEDDKPTIKVETNSEGKFVVTLTDKEGNVLDIADNVAVTLSVKTGATPESVTGDGVDGEIVDGEGSAEGKSFVIDPSKVDSVKYYKVRIDIGAK
jgi:hypothetical protein